MKTGGLPGLSGPDFFLVPHPHRIKRETTRTVRDPEFGGFQVPGMPLRFSEAIRQLLRTLKPPERFRRR
jgi:hypothetical protein